MRELCNAAIGRDVPGDRRQGVRPGLALHPTDRVERNRWQFAHRRDLRGRRRREARTYSRSPDHLIANQRIDQITVVTAIPQKPGKRWVEVRFSGENERVVIGKFTVPVITVLTNWFIKKIKLY